MTPTPARPEPTTRPWYRLPWCWLGLCGCRTNSDDTGIWGECVRCQRRVGFVTREELRRYAEHEYSKEIARGKP